MAATLLTADRSTRAAAAVDPGQPTSLTEAVFRSIADGAARTLDDLGTALAMPASRVADEVERLRLYGMSIRTVAGTVIAAPLVPLDREALGHAMTGLPAWDVQVVFSTQSTNSDLLAAVRAAASAVSVLRAAELQLAGRGRLGRRWSSAPGTSLTASFALTVRRRLSQLDGATLVCGLAVHAVLEGLGLHARLKWPNDVLVDGAKVAGILVEAHAAGEASVLVIGIGINVADGTEVAESPSGSVALRRTSLAAAGANIIDRNVLAARLARSLEAHMSAFESGGFEGFVERWNAVDAFADQTVTLAGSLGLASTGIARGVDDRGALLVDIDGQRQRIVAGDVSLRSVDGAQA